VLNATSSNISAISWRPVLVVEEAGVPGENIAIQVGEDPAIYALAVAIATSNSFLIPTHQVNALIMGPGGSMS
jgi:hypothetical protein